MDDSFDFWGLCIMVVAIVLTSCVCPPPLYSLSLSGCLSLNAFFKTLFASIIVCLKIRTYDPLWFGVVGMMVMGLHNHGPWQMLKSLILFRMIKL